MKTTPEYRTMLRAQIAPLGAYPVAVLSHEILALLDDLDEALEQRATQETTEPTEWR